MGGGIFLKEVIQWTQVEPDEKTNKKKKQEVEL